MRKTKSLGFTNKAKLFVLISGSILIFLAGSALLLLCFGLAVFGNFGKEKRSRLCDRFFEELFEF